MLLGVLASGFDLPAFGVTALLLWSGKSGIAIGIGRATDLLSTV
jgi:hypothetical protein